MIRSWLLIFCCFPLLVIGQAADTSRGDAMLARYFETETQKLASPCLTDITSAEDWLARRDTLRRQLLEMLGLDPLPEKRI